MKTCTKCNIEKPFTEFSKHKYRKEGLQSACKKCRAEYQKKYYQENKEIVAETNKKWLEKNKEKRNEYMRKYDKSRKDSDPLYKLRCNLATRTCIAFKKRVGEKTLRLSRCWVVITKLHLNI